MGETDSPSGRTADEPRGGHEAAKRSEDSLGMGTPQASASAIIVATGSPLLWDPLLGRPLLAWSVEAFERAMLIANIVLVVSPDRIVAARQIASREGWGKVRGSVAPARPRSGFRSDLQAGLDAFDLLAPPSEADGLVVVHEGLRPLVTAELLAAAIAAAIAAAPREGAAVGAEPVKETIKRVQGGLVAATLPRERLVSVQTPAVFTRGRLRSLLAAAPVDLDADLDAGVAAALAGLAIAEGLPIATYSSSAENLRVTTREELMVAEALLRRRGVTGHEPPRTP